MSDQDQAKKADQNKAPKRNRTPLLIAVATWIVRVIVGGVFIFSGFVKAVDPWGTFYKFGEYMSALGLPAMHNLVLAAVFLLCAFEFLVGVFLLLGCYRRSAPVMALVFMCVMLPLTLWIALANPVSDCGCFGDFLILSNWATFWKNVVLMLLIVWLLKFNRRCVTIISPAFQWIGALISFCFILAVSLIGYQAQPLLDFRPYAVGTEILPEDTSEPGDKFIFVYEKDGVREEFGVDDEMPSEEDGWTFVERKEIFDAPSAKADDEKTFRIWNRDGTEDETDDVLGQDGRMVLLLMPDMAAVSPATTWKINALHKWVNMNGAEMIAVVAGSSRQISEWEDLSMPDYEIFTADDTAIKELARGNPAVVSLENGKIKWKSTLGNLIVEETEAGTTFKPLEIVLDGKGTLRKIVWIYLALMLLPLLMTFTPRIRELFVNRGGNAVTRGDKAHP